MHLALIDTVIRRVVRQHRLNTTDAEDFSSAVHLRLIENECAILRKFEGRSSLQTFLTVVVQRMFQDYRIATWGKWRPSAAARRYGPVAVRLETLAFRDGLPAAAAVEIVRAHGKATETSSELEDLLGRMRPRMRRRFVGEDQLEHIPAAQAGPEECAMQADARRTLHVLRQSLGRLAESDRTLLRMRFGKDLRIADIARMNGLNNKALYRRFGRLMDRLKRDLQQQGITAADCHPGTA